MHATVQELIEKIATHPADPEVRTFDKLEIGQGIQQGDVYMHRVPNDWPHGAELGTRQVAVGTSIGSRHIMRGRGVEVYEGMKLPPSFKGTVPEGFRVEDFLGPVVVFPAGVEGLTHPEHAHHQNTSGECMTFQVTYQGDRSTMRRVQD